MVLQRKVRGRVHFTNSDRLFVATFIPTAELHTLGHGALETCFYRHA
jgi:hypothetical protein